jgi:hypothetical protein
MAPTRPDISGGMPRLDTCAKIGAYRVPKLGLPSWRLLAADRSSAKRVRRRSTCPPIWTHGQKRASAHRAAQLRWRYEARRMGKRHPNQRPALFHGPVLVTFLQRRRESAKQPCPPGHIYCLPCRAPKAPAGNMVEFVPVTDATGNLRGICPNCDRLIHRRVNQAKIKAIQGNLEITFADAPPRIRERIAGESHLKRG